MVIYHNKLRCCPATHDAGVSLVEKLAYTLSWLEICKLVLQELNIFEAKNLNYE